MKVLLSIKPEFAAKIFSGEKLFEFRRSIFKKPNINTVIIYVSSPVQMVMGEFKIDDIIYDDIRSLWEKTCLHSGISKEYFYSYFSDRDEGYAIKIKNVKRYRQPLCIKKDLGLQPPQSYTYL